MTETEAQKHGLSVHVARIPTAAVLRSRTLSETQGFLKALISPDSGKILGFTMIGPEAGEVMAVVQMAMLTGASYMLLREAIIAHPTMSEGLNVLFSKLERH